jgi:hypothetical protein
VKILKESREGVEDASSDRASFPRLIYASASPSLIGRFVYLWASIVRGRIDARREELRLRRATLALARDAHVADVRASNALDEALAAER